MIIKFKLNNRALATWYPKNLKEFLVNNQRLHTEKGCLEKN